MIPMPIFWPPPPGAAFEYSNMAIALAGYLVEQISGTAFDQFTRESIFDPMCMDHSGWFLADFDTSLIARPYSWTGTTFEPYAHYGFADYPNGLLRTTALDLARFMITYLQEGSFNDQQILEAGTVGEMLSLQVPDLEPTQGLGWYREQIYLNGGATVLVMGT